jgi:hypothetical protein
MDSTNRFLWSVALGVWLATALAILIAKSDAPAWCVPVPIIVIGVAIFLIGPPDDREGAA